MSKGDSFSLTDPSDQAQDGSALNGDLLPRAATEALPDLPRQSNIIDSFVDEETLDRAIATRANLNVLNDPRLTEITYEFRKNRGLVRASGVLTRVERKVLNILAWNAIHEIGMRTLHEISIKEAEDLLHDKSETTTGGSQRKLLLDTLRSLKSIQLNLYYDSQGREDDVTSTGILSDFQFKKSDGKLIYGFNQITAALLSDAAFAAQLDIRLQAKMRTRYSLALMEIACSYLAEGATPMLPVDVWRRDFNVLDDPTYNEYRYFNAKIIQPSIREVRDIAKLDLTMETETAGRKVVAFRFVIARCNDAEAGTLDSIGVQKSPVWKRLTRIGVSPPVATEAVIRDPVHAAQVADETEKRFKEGTIKNPGAWAAHFLTKQIPLKSALEIEVEKEKKKAAAKAKKSKPANELSPAQLKANVTKERKRLRDKIVTEHIASLSSSDLFVAAKQFITKNSFIPSSFRAELAEKLRDGACEDGTLNSETTQWLISNSMLRSYLYSQADPGNARVDSLLEEKFGESLRSIQDMLDL